MSKYLGFGVQGGFENAKGTENLFKEIMTENSQIQRRI
jgi:hypothetical protein